MNELDALAKLLHNQRVSIQGDRCCSFEKLNSVISSLEQHNQAGCATNFPKDLQSIAVQNF